MNNGGCEQICEDGWNGPVCSCWPGYKFVGNKCMGEQFITKNHVKYLKIKDLSLIIYSHSHYSLTFQQMWTNVLRNMEVAITSALTNKDRITASVSQVTFTHQMENVKVISTKISIFDGSHSSLINWVLSFVLIFTIPWTNAFTFYETISHWPLATWRVVCLLRSRRRTFLFWE